MKPKDIFNIAVRLLGQPAATLLSPWTSAFMLLACSSCSRSVSTPPGHTSENATLLAKWRASDTPFKDRLDSADGLLSTNMLASDVESLLGPPTIRGEGILPAPGQLPGIAPGPSLHYAFTDGKLSVFFKWVTNAGKLEARYSAVGILLDAPEQTNSKGSSTR